MHVARSASDVATRALLVRVRSREGGLPGTGVSGRAGRVGASRDGVGWMRRRMSAAIRTVASRSHGVGSPWQSVASDRRVVRDAARGVRSGWGRVKCSYATSYLRSSRGKAFARLG